MAVGGCKEAEASRVHSQARHSASTQLPGLQLLVVRSLILWREVHTPLSSGQDGPLHSGSTPSLSPKVKQNAYLVLRQRVARHDVTVGGKE